MVDDVVHRQAAELRLMLRQGAAVKLHDRAPAERADARRHLVHMREGQRAAEQVHEADAARAGLGQAVELLVGDAGLHHHHRARVVAERRHAGHGRAIVVAIGVRLHHDRALEPEPGLHLGVVGDRRVRRIERAGQRGIGAAVEMHVRVARAGRRFQARRWAGESAGEGRCIRHAASLPIPSWSCLARPSTSLLAAAVLGRMETRGWSDQVRP